MPPLLSLSMAIIAHVGFQVFCRDSVLVFLKAVEILLLNCVRPENKVQYPSILTKSYK